jgi:hypothetical protein
VRHIWKLVGLVSAVGAFALLFVLFRRHTAFIGALAAFGQVAAAVFAAVAATQSFRAANESERTAARTTEALARVLKPRLIPGVTRENGRMLGTIACGEGHSAVDIQAEWQMINRMTVVVTTPRLDAIRTELPASTRHRLDADLHLTENARYWDELSDLRIRYWDEQRVGHWEDVWRVANEVHDGLLLLVESRLTR